MKKQLIIVGIIVILLTVGLSGCNKQNTDNTNNEVTNYIEDVTINGMEVTQTINKPNKTIKLYVNGMDCDVTVTKETNVIAIYLNGMDSIVRVSHSHSFTSYVNGLGSEIVYYD